MDLALNNQQRLICHKTQETKPTDGLFHYFAFYFYNVLAMVLYCFVHIIYTAVGVLSM